MANDPRLWSPLNELDRFRRDFDDLFDRFLGNRMGPLLSKSTEAPALDSFIDDGKLVVRIDLPGIDPKDVEITVMGDTLTLRGKREQRSEEKSKRYLHREVTYGSFERSVRLPPGVKADQVKAAYQNGVLELNVPVPTEAAPRKVPIEIERK